MDLIKDSSFIDPLLFILHTTLHIINNFHPVVHFHIIHQRQCLLASNCPLAGFMQVLVSIKS